MNKSERDLISKYLYFAEERLIGAVRDCSYRYVRRDLDSIDLLEEILARNKLECFREFAYDVTKLLNLDKSTAELTQHLKLNSDDEERETFYDVFGNRTG